MDADVEVFGDVDECALDGGGGKGGHHAVEGNKCKVDGFLRLLEATVTSHWKLLSPWEHTFHLGQLRGSASSI